MVDISIITIIWPRKILGKIKNPRIKLKWSLDYDEKDVKKQYLIQELNENNIK